MKHCGWKDPSSTSTISPQTESQPQQPPVQPAPVEIQQPQQPPPEPSIPVEVQQPQPENVQVPNLPNETISQEKSPRQGFVGNEQPKTFGFGQAKPGGFGSPANQKFSFGGSSTTQPQTSGFGQPTMRRGGLFGKRPNPK